MAERPRTKPLTPEQILALPDGARVVVEWCDCAPLEEFTMVPEHDRVLFARVAQRGHVAAVWLAED